MSGQLVGAVEFFAHEGCRHDISFVDAASHDTRYENILAVGAEAALAKVQATKTFDKFVILSFF